MRKNPYLNIILGAFLALCVVPWTWWFPSHIHLDQILLPSSWQHPFGTDSMGRDLLGRVHQAVWFTVFPLWTVALLGWMLGIGIALGLNSWRYSEKILTPVYASTSMFVQIPTILWVILGQMVWSHLTTLSLGIMFAMLAALRSYTQVQQFYWETQHKAYWQSHQLLGGTRFDRLWHYGICQEWRKPLLQECALLLIALFFTELGLSYLGLGIQEPQASLGNILAPFIPNLLFGHDLLPVSLIIGVIYLLHFIPDFILSPLRHSGRKLLMLGKIRQQAVFFLIQRHQPRR